MPQLLDVTPRQRSPALLTHPLLRVPRIWESIFYSQVLFTLWYFLLLSRLPWCLQFNLKGSRASCWSSKHSPSLTIALCTAIHKRGILVDSIYVPKTSFKVRLPQLWNLPVTGFEFAFLKVPWIKSRLPWELDHRIFWVLINEWK